MADVSKIKLPNNQDVNIKDYRISGVDTTPTSGSGNVITSGGVHTALAGKQATLVSGTNIKTINNTSLLGIGNMNLVPYNGVLMPTNPFGGSGVYINSIDNAFHSADKRFWVKITLHSKTVSGVSYPYADTSKEITDPDYWVDSPVINTLTNAANIFNGSYESYCSCPAGQYMKIHIQFSPFSDSWNPATAPRMSGFPYGSYYLSYYYQYTPGRASQLRVYNIYAPHTVGWHLYSPTVFSGSLTGNYIECFTDNNDFSRTCIEFIIYGQDSKNTAITQIDYKLYRPDLASSGSTVTKYADQSLYHNFYWYKHNDEAQPTNTIAISPESGTITADKFVKSGGTSSQFLKADGSVDNNTYAPKASPALSGTPTAPTAPAGTNTTQIATTAFVTNAINALPEPMIFQGTLGTGGTITTLPAAAAGNTGYTYKVITNGTYQSIAAKDGDTFISNGSSWTLIPSGDEPSGTVTNIATGTGLIGGPITTTGTISIDTDVVAQISDIPTQTTVSGWGFTKNTGTITGITMNGASKGTSGVVNLGTVITSETQPDWNVTSTSSAAYIKNKPTIPTVPTAMTATEANAGTATTARTITAAVLAGAINNKITCMTQNEVDATVNTIFS